MMLGAWDLGLVREWVLEIWDFFTRNSEGNLDIEVSHFQRMLLNEISAGFDFVAH